MSAVRIGMEGARPTVATTENPALAFIGRFTKWIPGDVIALYAATVALMQPALDSGEDPVISFPAWLIALVATPLVVYAIGLAAKTSKLWLRAFFSIPAFAIWSSTVPHSAWQGWPLFNDNPVLAYLVLGLLALILPPFADYMIGDET